MTRTLQNFVAGDWVDATGEDARTVVSPVTGETLAEAPNASPEDVRRATQAAHDAQPAWAALSVFDRAEVMHRIGDLLEERKEELARSLTLEDGKPYKAEALDDIHEMADNFRSSAEDAKRLESSVIPTQAAAKRMFTIRVPNGVYAVARGAEVVLGGSRDSGRPTELYYQPTVVANVGRDTLVNRDETFGPIVPLISVDGDDDALAVANESHLGLQAAVYTRDLARAFRFANELRVGSVVVNDSTMYWETLQPFGGAAGTKTGWGRVGGRHALEDMTDLRMIILDVGGS